MDNTQSRRERAWAEGRHPKPLNEGRSRNMQANKRTGTKPEVRLRSHLHRLGYRFRKDLRLDLPDTRVRPDIVFTRQRVAVFVDGCFWHACPQHGRQPGINGWYWGPKLQRNVERDRRVNAALTTAGWAVVRVWEHDAVGAAAQQVIERLTPQASARPLPASRAPGSKAARATHQARSRCRAASHG